MDREKALKLAAKLLAMDTGAGCTAEEAATAAEKFAKLTQENDISLLDIQAEQMKSKIRAEQARPPCYTVEIWVRELLSHLADAFHCHPVIEGENTIVVIGEETEAALCRYFLAYLLRALWDGRKAYCKTVNFAEKKRQGYSRHAVYSAWYSGAIRAVYVRLKEMYADWYGSLDEKDKTKANGLIVVKGEAVKDYIATRYQGTLRKGRATQQRIETDFESLESGTGYGETVPLAQGLRTNPNTLKGLN